MEELYLVYENKGTLTIFPISPRYIKGQKFSAKIIEEKRSRSFAYSMMYGVFSNRKDAEKLIIELQKIKEPNPRIHKIETELAKLRPKLDHLEAQQEKLEEKIEKKQATEERLHEKEELTDTQYEQLKKIEIALDELGKKEDELSDAYDFLDAKIDTLEEEQWPLEVEANRIESEFWELKRKLCIEKIESMEIEVRPEIKKQKEKIDNLTTIPPVPPTIEKSPSSIEKPVKKQSFLSKVFDEFIRGLRN